MKLSEYLPSIRQSYIKLGAEYGSGWIYAGSLQGYLDTKDDVDAEALRKLKASVDYAKNKVRRAIVAKDVEAYVKASESLTDKKRILNEFKPLMDRTVVETSIAHPIVDDVDAPVRRIIVKGEDFGDFDCIGEDGRGVTTKETSKRKSKRK